MSIGGAAGDLWNRTGWRIAALRLRWTLVAGRREDKSVRGRNDRSPRLTLVASSEPAPVAETRRAAGGRKHAVVRDWSELMRRTQDGDRLSYRTLLDDITPYLRALAARCFRDGGDIEDAVQDVLMTVHAVRHAYDPCRPF